MQQSEAIIVITIVSNIDFSCTHQAQIFIAAFFIVAAFQVDSRNKRRNCIAKYNANFSP